MHPSSFLARLLPATAVAAALIVLSVLSGCGQRGPLFLPAEAGALPAPLPPHAGMTQA